MINQTHTTQYAGKKKPKKRKAYANKKNSKR